MKNNLRDITISKYAPVIIPTLCRYKHLISLLQSLSNCRLADKTEVYVGLDYPSKPSHEIGHKKILDYLESVGDSEGSKQFAHCREQGHGQA